MIYRKNVFYDTEKVERRRGMLRRVTQESLFRSTVTASLYLFFPTQKLAYVLGGLVFWFF